MTRTKRSPQVDVLPSTGLSCNEVPVIAHLKAQLDSGRDWCEALLEAVGQWTMADEEYNGRTYSYLLLGEAFDWLLLAERLCSELDGAIPGEAKEDLLFRGKLPESFTAERFRVLIGHSKHRAFLNYWYGVVIEEALQLKTEEELRKQHHARGFPDTDDLTEEVFAKLYEGGREELFRDFLKETYKKRRASRSLSDLKEFTYWLFKRRVRIWDPARVASDTRKGLVRLGELRSSDCYLGS
ncbi:MAG: hypothetical protein J4G01_05325 [Dehalococcoidia bacterium]|nr:hypothetical protein [Dehalococcoidia bacterium]